jgi:hypothetical protein
MDDAGKMQMTSDLAKLMVMHKMAAQMCTDEKCVMMMKDADTTKIMDDATKMAADVDKMKMMEDAVMKDPAAMKSLMMMCMNRMAGMREHAMDGKMDGSKMEGGAMQGGMMGGDKPK